MLMSVAQNSAFDLRTYVCTLYVKMAISLPTVCSVGMHSNKGSKHGEGTAEQFESYCRWYTKEEKRADRKHRYTVCTRDSKTRIAT